jgi:hypothetical protein
MNNITELEIEKNLLQVIMTAPAASYTLHRHSRGTVTDTTQASEREITEFMLCLQLGIQDATLMISNIDWEESGNCIGDELFPTILRARKIDDTTYLMLLEGYRIEKEFVYKIEKKSERKSQEDAGLLKILQKVKKII